MRRRFGLFGAIFAGFLLGACALLPSGVQTLVLRFELDRAAPDGERIEVYAHVLPSPLKVRKHFLRVSGQLHPNGAPPAEVRVFVTAEDLFTGEVYDRFDFRLEPDLSGSFSALERLKTNLRAGTLQRVFVESVGADLAAGAGIDLCVAVARKKPLLATVPACGAPPPPDGDVVIAYGEIGVPSFDSESFENLHWRVVVEGVLPAGIPADHPGLVLALRDAGRPLEDCSGNGTPFRGCASINYSDASGVFPNRLAIELAGGRREFFLSETGALADAADPLDPG